MEKTPDLLDFAIVQSLNKMHFKLSSSSKLSSDHTPITINYLQNPIQTENRPILNNSTTDWNKFKSIFSEKLNCNIPLRTPKDIEYAVDYLTKIIRC